MARIRYTRCRPPPHQGRRWPWTLQQVQIERVAKNSKPRNGFEFSYTPLATSTPTVPSRLPSHYNAIQLCGSFGFVVLQ